MSVSSRASLLGAALLVLAASPALAQPPAGPPLAYADALRRVLGSHESLQAADKEVRQREEERSASKSLYWPKVDASVRGTTIDRPIDIDLGPIRQAILALHPGVPASRVPAFVEHVQDAQFWLADVKVTWPIYTGGKVAAATHAAEAQVADATAQRRGTAQSLSTELARRYFGLRLALSALDVRQQVRAGLEQHLHDAIRLEEEGLISHAERLHAEVARSEADRQLRRAAHDVEIARAGLANILSDDRSGDPASPLFVLPAIDPLDAFEQQAQEQHPAFERFAAQRSMAQQALEAQKGRLLPDVYLFGMRQLHEGDLTLLDPKWAAGISASITLFDGFDRSHKTAAARLQQGRVDDLERRARRDVATLVEKRYREVEKARDLFAALQPAQDLASENLRVRTRAFEEGLATSLDVVDARLSASRVELERLSAAYDFDVALAELLEASGQGERFEALRAAGAPVTVAKTASLSGARR
jgi:outer membrane protein TolC